MIKGFGLGILEEALKAEEKRVNYCCLRIMFASKLKNRTEIGRPSST